MAENRDDRIKKTLSSLISKVQGETAELQLQADAQENVQLPEDTREKGNFLIVYFDSKKQKRCTMVSEWEWIEAENGSPMDCHGFFYCRGKKYRVMGLSKADFDKAVAFDGVCLDFSGYQVIAENNKRDPYIRNTKDIPLPDPDVYNAGGTPPVTHSSEWIVFPEGVTLKITDSVRGEKLSEKIYAAKQRREKFKLITVFEDYANPGKTYTNYKINGRTFKTLLKTAETTGVIDIQKMDKTYGFNEYLDAAFDNPLQDYRKAKIAAQEAGTSSGGRSSKQTSPAKSAAKGAAAGVAAAAVTGAALAGAGASAPKAEKTEPEKTVSAQKPEKAVSEPKIEKAEPEKPAYSHTSSMSLEDTAELTQAAESQKEIAPQAAPYEDAQAEATTSASEAAEVPEEEAQAFDPMTAEAENAETEETAVEADQKEAAAEETEVEEAEAADAENAEAADETSNAENAFDAEAEETAEAETSEEEAAAEAEEAGVAEETAEAAEAEEYEEGAEAAESATVEANAEVAESEEYEADAEASEPEAVEASEPAAEEKAEASEPAATKEKTDQAEARSADEKTTFVSIDATEELRQKPAPLEEGLTGKTVTVRYVMETSELNSSMLPEALKPVEAREDLSPEEIARREAEAEAERAELLAKKQAEAAMAELIAQKLAEATVEKTPEQKAAEAEAARRAEEEAAAARAAERAAKRLEEAEAEAARKAAEEEAALLRAQEEAALAAERAAKAQAEAEAAVAKAKEARARQAARKKAKNDEAAALTAAALAAATGREGGDPLEMIQPGAAGVDDSTARLEGISDRLAKAVEQLTKLAELGEIEPILQEVDGGLDVLNSGAVKFKFLNEKGVRQTAYLDRIYYDYDGDCTYFVTTDGLQYYNPRVKKDEYRAIEFEMMDGAKEVNICKQGITSIYVPETYEEKKKQFRRRNNIQDPLS